MHGLDDQPALQTRDLTVRYGSTLAVDRVTLSIEPGELVALVGPNGAGKTSLLRAALGLVRYAGDVAAHGVGCRGQRRVNLAFVPQRHEVDLDFPISVQQLTLTGRRTQRRLWQRPSRADRQAALRALARVGLDGHERRTLAELSGGQAQRAFLARALAQEADVLLLDEPFTGVEQRTADALLDLFEALTDAGVALLVATHDLSLVRRRFARCLALRTRLVGDGAPEQVLSATGVERIYVDAFTHGWLTDPYSSGFMQRALAASLIIGALAPLVGVWIVLRRLAYLADAMGHASLGGVAAAYLAGWSLTAGAVAAGICMATLMALLSSHPRLREDAIVGIVEVCLFAGGVLVISASDSVQIDLTHILFGSITTVTTADLTLNVALGLLASLTLAVLFDDLRAASFDPLHARLVGIRVGALRTLLLVLLAITVVLALQTVGLLMSIALFVVPAAAARLCSRTLATMSALAAVFGTLSTVGGLTIAYHAGTAPGATIALTAIAILAVSFLATRPRATGRPRAHLSDLPG